MKRVYIIATIITLAATSMAAQGVLPLSVEQFMNEMRMNSFQSIGFSKYVPPQTVEGREVVDAFVAIENDRIIDKLKTIGVEIQTVFDGFVTARIPVDLLERVSTMAGVTDIDVSRRVELCTDSTLSVTHAGDVLNGSKFGLPKSYDGKGVIVGVIDMGFDYQHRTYRRNDDTRVTRIVRVYDTRKTSGHPARNSQGTKLPGSVFMNEEIYSLKNDGTGTHGTHTSSIAAGSHVNGYGGMAPGADIVLCAVSVLDGGLSTVEIANCIRYITCYADSVGKPCVMSLSVSTPNGQHDGSDYLSKVVEQTVGEGRIFVISAGNNGDRPMYAHNIATQTKPVNFLFKSKTTNNVDSSYFYQRLNADFWMRGYRVRPSYRWHIIDLATGHIVWESDSLTQTAEITTSQIINYYGYDTNLDSIGWLHAAVGSSSDGKKFNLDISMYNLVCRSYYTVNGVRNARYAIGISIYSRNASQSHVDAWVCHSTGRFGSYDKAVTTMNGDVINNFYTPSNSDCNIGTYAVNDSVISAGAYAARNSYYSLPRNNIVTDNSITVGDIANFSSFQVAGTGPTGDALPTICAPGITVVSAFSRYSSFASSSSTVMKTDDGSVWGVMSGTSMSAPTVAGIIAQWLQANPNLTVKRIKEILAQTAIRDEFTMGANSTHFGPNGKIDALAGMRMVLDDMHFELGDVNCDGEINIGDVTAIIAYLLDSLTPEWAFLQANADMDGNGEINIEDITLLINYLLTN
ncbi:MAG: S8 family serine peptidase [Muribaculaceae bacterium]|nr:S8 family serine peptidase [Muribaculaceae bacterium]